ncbi:MAG: nucleotidyltransferase family protein [Leptolyngbyaceae cyanobacterium bins.59]|nr:nucleotidyltransferase family protein [Leptolyngbyaceae cyanobacterium bins.59]
MTHTQHSAPIGPIEQQFLYLCLQGRWNPEALSLAHQLATTQNLDWTALQKTVQTEGLAPLLYRVIRNQAIVPAVLEQDWSLAYYRNACRNTLLLKELVKVLQEFTAQQISVIVLKGAVLAEVMYQDVALRPMSDIDLLILPDTVVQVRQVLQTQGYQPYNLEPQAGYTEEFRNEESFFREGLTQVGIDLHWQLISLSYYQRVLKTEWFWQTALPVEFDRTPALMLGYEAQLLHLCAHLLWHHNGQGLLWQQDIAEFLVTYAQKIQWEVVLHQAEQMELVLPLQQVLLPIVDRWHIPFPAHIRTQIETLQPSSTEKTLFCYLNTTYLRITLRHFLADLIGMGTWEKRARFLWNTVFPSRNYMQQRYQIAHPILIPLYYPYRLFRGLEKKG